MADIAPALHIDTDRLLRELAGEWGVGVRTIDQWSDLSDYEKMVFIETWAIPRGYYQELVDRTRRGELTTEQQRRFAELRAWFEPHRAALEALLESSAL
jgi:hypothetical protein